MSSKRYPPCRIIIHAPRDAHSALLLKQLNLNSLETRRLNHMRNLCRKIVTGNAQRYILDMFQFNKDGSLQSIVTTKPRISYSRRRFCLLAQRISQHWPMCYMERFNVKDLGLFLIVNYLSHHIFPKLSLK